MVVSFKFSFFIVLYLLCGFRFIAFDPSFDTLDAVLPSEQIKYLPDALPFRDTVILKLEVKLRGCLISLWILSKNVSASAWRSFETLTLNQGRSPRPPLFRESNEVFFLQAHKNPITEDDVIQHFDADLVSSLNQLFRRPDVLLARLWVARWVVGRLLWWTRKKSVKHSALGRLCRKKPLRCVCRCWLSLVYIGWVMTTGTLFGGACRAFSKGFFQWIEYLEAKRRETIELLRLNRTDARGCSPWCRV